MFQDSHEAAKTLSWEIIWLEFEAKLLMLFQFFEKLPPNTKKFLAFVISLLLKKHCKHMSLVQQAISVLLVLVLVNRFLAF